MPQEAYQVALFLQDGGRTVFLQDADPCAVKPEKLAAVIRRVRERFPAVDRVTTYGRASTLARRTAEQLALLVDAGLTRVHLGLESGADEVLMAIDKGCTSGDLIAAGENVVRAGLELCFYLMPGLGGRAAAAAHVAGSARVIRAVAAAAPAERPLVVRLRTAAVVPGTPLAEREAAGEFVLPDDVEVQELRDLLGQLGDARLELRSDHALNLLPGLEGSLPADRERLVGMLDEFLALSRDEQARYAVGARLGIYRALGDRLDAQRRAMLEQQFGGYRPDRRTSCCRRPRRCARRFLESPSRVRSALAGPAQPSSRRPGARVADEVTLHRRTDGRHQLLHPAGEWLDAGDVPHHRQADELGAHQRGAQLRVGLSQRLFVIGPNTRRPR